MSILSIEFILQDAGYTVSVTFHIDTRKKKKKKHTHTHTYFTSMDRYFYNGSSKITGPNLLSSSVAFWLKYPLNPWEGFLLGTIRYIAMLWITNAWLKNFLFFDYRLDACVHRLSSYKADILHDFNNNIDFQL